MKMAERSTSKKALQQTIILARGAKSKEDGGLAPPNPGWFNPDYLNPVVVPASSSNDSDAARTPPPCPARKASSECKKLFSPRQNPADGTKSKRQRHRTYKCRRSSSSWGPRTGDSNWPSLDDLIPRDPHRISDSDANIIAAGLSKKQFKSKKKDIAVSSPRPTKQHSNDLIGNEKPPSRNSPGKSNSSNFDHRQSISPPKSVTPPSTRTSPVADCSSLFPSLKSSPTGGGDRRKSSGPSIRLLSTKLSQTHLPTCTNQSVKLAQKFSDTKLLNFSDPTKLARQLTAVIPKESLAMNAGQNGGDMKLIESPEVNPFKPKPFFEAIESPVVLENLEIKKFNVSTPFFERKSSLESLDPNKKVVSDSGQFVDKSAGDQKEFEESTVSETSNNKIAEELMTLKSKMAAEAAISKSKIATEPNTLNTKMATELINTPARQSPRKLHGKTPRGIQEAVLTSPGRSPCQALSKFSSQEKKSKALDLIPSSSGRTSKPEASNQKSASESVSSTTIILSSTTTILNTTLVVQQSKATTCDTCGKPVQVQESTPSSARKAANSNVVVDNFEEMTSEMSEEISSGLSKQLDGFAIQSAPISNSPEKPFEHNKSDVLHQEDDQMLHKEVPVTNEDEDSAAKNKLVWVPTSFFNRINKNTSVEEPISSEAQPDLISGGAIISKCKSEESQSSVDSNGTFIVHAGETVSVDPDGPTTSSSDTAIQLGETQYLLPLITHDEQKFFGCIRPVRRGDGRRQISSPQFVKAKAWKSIRCQGGGLVTNTRITCAATAVLTSSTRSSTTRSSTRRRGPRILKLLAPAIPSSSSQGQIHCGSTRRKGSSSAGILLVPAGSGQFAKEGLGQYANESPPKSSPDDIADELSKFELDPIFAFRIPSFELIPLQRIIEDQEEDLRDSVDEPDDWARCEGCNIIDLITPAASTQEIMREADEVVDLSEYRKPGSPQFNVAQYYDDDHLTQVSTQPEQFSKFTTSVIQASGSNSTNVGGWSSGSSTSSRSFYNSQARLKSKSHGGVGWKGFGRNRFSRFCRFRHFRSLFPSCCSSSSSSSKPSHDSSRSSIIQLY